MNKPLAQRLADWEELAQNAGYASRDLAKLYGISDRHLRRLFREIFGRSPKAMLHEKQLEEAEIALRTCFLVKRVALEFQYSHSGSFSHWFKAQKKMTPSQFLEEGHLFQTGCGKNWFTCTRPDSSLRGYEHLRAPKPEKHTLLHAK